MPYVESDSDKTETEVWKYVSWVPVLNVAYAIPRSVIYAAKGNGHQAVKSAIAIPSGLASAAGWLIGGPAGGYVVQAVSAVATTGFLKAGDAAYEYFRPKGDNTGGATSDATASGSAACNEIKELKSPNGRFTFVVQPDRNIVLCEEGQPIWASDTSTTEDKGPYRLLLHPNGNLVGYDCEDRPFWASVTADKGTGPYTLAVQDDGKAAIYDKDMALIVSTSERHAAASST